MEILTNPAINIDNKNIRVYWNIDQNAVAFIVTNSEDNKRLDEGIFTSPLKVTILTLTAPSQHKKTGFSRSFSFRW